EGIRDRHEHIDLKKIYDEYGAYLATILNEGVQKGAFRQMSADMVASFIVGGMDGLALQWLARKKKFPIKDAQKEFIYTILNGIETS
ncbi:MAG: TetR/AcrR family transcriptional regulator C-terminal domain-containing protein, partial [bacterium]